MPKNLLIVESPAKARTINKYLGPGFEVLASYGHVRDLRAKNGAVDPAADFAMSYEVVEKNERHVSAIAKAMRKADALYLATDPDREGEAISWHVVEILKERNILKDKPIHRVVFHEITKRAIQEAVEHPRALSSELIDAQQARRALDYLVGFNLSPLLWRKVRRGLSAGRVQTPALRLIVEREAEIERFQKREYWTIEADLVSDGQRFVAKLAQYDGNKLKQFDIHDEAQAAEIREELEANANGWLTVGQIEKKQRKRNPAPPFTTSTLQQEASRKLGFTAQRTMRTAQQLYEGVDIDGESIGLITYMRTDSVTLSDEAIANLRDFISARFGEDQLPEMPRRFKTTAKNAQEAHEAVRPTAAGRSPDGLAPKLAPDQAKLYALIWKRTVACQMKHATIDTVSATLPCGDGNLFRATGSTVSDPGFLAVYEEGVDTAGQKSEDERKLPLLREGQKVDLSQVRPEQHFTEPPPRYTEATLVKTLEEYGIGRPSTYASIISTLQQREYVELEKRRFTPTDVGKIVSKFLSEHFLTYVDYEFTAKLEDDLDAVSRGEKRWVPLLREFWQSFKRQVDEKSESVQRSDIARELGPDPKTGLPVSVRMGRFGPFVQIGTRDDEEKPRFASLRPGQSMDKITFEEALELFRLPRHLGETAQGEPVSSNIGRFGPYIRYGNKFASLPKEDDPYTVTIERALIVVDEKKQLDANREIQVFEAQGIKVLNGRYGPYATNGGRNAKIPKDIDPKTISVEECERLLAAAPASRGGRSKKKFAKKASADNTVAGKSVKKKATKKKVAKKKVAKKKVSKKKVVKKAAGKTGNAVVAADEPA